MIETKNPHARGAGAQGVAGNNAESFSTPLPNAAMLLSYADASLLAEALATIHRLSSQASALVIEKMDLQSGDPDFEDDDPPEAAGDEADAAYVEWHTMRGSQKRGPNILAGHEDDEEDDAPEEDDPSGQCDEDELNTRFDMARYTPGGDGPGCPFADPGGEDDGF